MIVPLLRTTRPHQWIKNVLVFLPLAAAHRSLNSSAVIPTLMAFAAMVVASSAVYILNDLFDLEADRMHPTKRNRPIARGEVTRSSAIVFACLLVLIMGGLLTLMPRSVAGWVGVYLVISTLYSTKLKCFAIVDVLALAVLYTIRIMVGGAASGLPISHWLLALSMFFFFSLALLKRYVELTSWPEDHASRRTRRDYRRSDLPTIHVLGITSGLLSVLVLALYITSGDAVALYASSGWLWGLCVLLLYWLCYIWLCAARGEVHDDPVWFALSDRASLIVAMLAIGVVIVAI